MTSEPERTPHGGLQIEVVVPDEGEPARDEAAAPEPSQDPPEQVPALLERGRDRVRSLVQRLRSRGSGEEAGDHEAPDDGPRAKGFTVLSYREGAGDAPASIPGTAALKPATRIEEEASSRPSTTEAPDETEEPAQAEPTLQEPPTPDTADAPKAEQPIDAADEAQPSEARQPADGTAIELVADEAPAGGSAPPEAPAATETAEAADEAQDQTRDEVEVTAEGEPAQGLVARVRARFRSSDDEPAEPVEPEGASEAETTDERPGLLARLRATLTPSPGPDRTMATPGEALRAPVPTPPLQQDAVPTTEALEEVEPEEARDDGPGLFGSLKRKLSRPRKDDQTTGVPPGTTRPGTPVPTPPVAQGDPLSGLLPDGDADAGGSGLFSKLLRRGSNGEDGEEATDAADEGDEPEEEPLEEVAQGGLFSRFRRKGASDEGEEGVEASEDSETTGEAADEPAGEDAKRGLLARLRGKGRSDEPGEATEEPQPVAPIEAPKVDLQAPPTPPEGEAVPAPLPAAPPAPSEGEAPTANPEDVPTPAAPVAPIEHRSKNAVRGGVPTPPVTDHRVEGDLEDYLSPVEPAPPEPPAAEAPEAGPDPVEPPSRPRSHQELISRVDQVLDEREDPVAKRLRVLEGPR